MEVFPALTDVDLVIGMMGLLSDESKWTQGAMAQDAQGKSCICHDPRAVAWCLAGAMAKILEGHRKSTRINGHQIAQSGNMASRPVYQFMLSMTKPNCSLSLWNDVNGRTYAEVKDLLNQALAWAQSN